jgi:hypothetical protein
LINIQESEPQVLDATESFFVRNPDANSIHQRAKSKTVKVDHSPIFKKMRTIERVLTEKIQNNEDFENILTDPLFLKLVK